MKTRYEQMLESIANGEPITSEPISRLERFLKAYANNESVSDLPEPTCREEDCWLSIIKGEPITSTPHCKREQCLKAIANNEPIPEGSNFGREVQLFKKIKENTGGGTDGPVGPSDPDDPTVVDLNYVTNGMFYIRTAHSTIQNGELLILR